MKVVFEQDVLMVALLASLADLGHLLNFLKVEELGYHSLYHVRQTSLPLVTLIIDLFWNFIQNSQILNHVLPHFHLQPNSFMKDFWTEQVVVRKYRLLSTHFRMLLFRNSQLIGPTVAHQEESYQYVNYYCYWKNLILFPMIPYGHFLH